MLKQWRINKWPWQAIVYGKIKDCLLYIIEFHLIKIRILIKNWLIEKYNKNKKLAEKIIF